MIWTSTPTADAGVIFWKAITRYLTTCWKTLSDLHGKLLLTQSSWLDKQPGKESPSSGHVFSGLQLLYYMYLFPTLNTYKKYLGYFLWCLPETRFCSMCCCSRNNWGLSSCGRDCGYYCRGNGACSCHSVSGLSRQEKNDHHHKLVNNRAASQLKILKSEITLAFNRCKMLSIYIET